MKQELIKNQENKLFKQRLQRVHVTVGISFSILMYLAVFFGVFAILLPYIQVWEKPSRHYQMPDITKIDYNNLIEPILKDPEYPKINPIEITLPGYLEDPALKIYTKFTKRIIINPNTTEKFYDDEKVSNLARFLNHMHYGRPFKAVGRALFGFIAVAGMFLIIGGLIQILIIKYQKNAKSLASKFSKWHRKIFTWLFLPFFIITLTGAMLNIGYSGASPTAYFNSEGKTSYAWILVKPNLYPNEERIKKSNKNLQMLAINELLKKAQKINPDIDFQKIKLLNWGNSNARAKFLGYNPYMPFLNGISNRPYVTLSAVDGKLIEQQKVLDKHWNGIFYDSMLFMHFLFGVDNFTRMFMAFIMSLCAFALGLGVLLWLEKKAIKFPTKIPFYHWVAKLSLATMIGVIPATGVLFLLQWLLPFDMPDRFLIQRGLFAVFWIGTLTWSFYRINSYKAAKEFLLLGGILFISSAFVHFYNSGFSPFELYSQNMTTILSVDIGLIIFGILLFIIGKKLPYERKIVQNFWAKKL